MRAPPKEVPEPVVLAVPELVVLAVPELVVLAVPEPVEGPKMAFRKM